MKAEAEVKESSSDAIGVATVVIILVLGYCLFDSFGDVEKRLDQLEQKIQQRLEIIETKLDRIIANDGRLIQ